MKIKKKLTLEERLRLFHKKANEIENCTFAKSLPEIINNGFKISGSVNEPIVIKQDNVNDDSFGNFILKFRLFEGPTDNIKIEHIAKLFVKQNLCPDHTQQIKLFLSEFEDYKNKRVKLTFEDHQLTNYELLELLLYGEYAHSNADKYLEADEILNKFNISGAIYKNTLYLILYNYLKLIRMIRQATDLYFKSKLI